MGGGVTGPWWTEERELGLAAEQGSAWRLGTAVLPPSLQIQCPEPRWSPGLAHSRVALAFRDPAIRRPLEPNPPTRARPLETELCMGQSPLVGCSVSFRTIAQGSPDGRSPSMFCVFLPLGAWNTLPSAALTWPSPRHLRDLGLPRSSCGGGLCPLAWLPSPAGPPPRTSPSVVHRTGCALPL